MLFSINIKSNRYPTLLKTSIKPPKTLYCYGANFPYEDLEKGNAVSIVGSRHITEYGKRVIEKFIKDIAPQKPVIVSGYMYGCDFYAHFFALKYGLPTVAVLPCGVSTRLLRHDPEIYDDIVEKGCFVSEYPNDASPSKWDFVLRNRIIAGLTNSLIVVEAAEKSGSLTTANYAFKSQRKVYVVPGPIFNKNFVGNYHAYKLGAEFIVSGRDALSIPIKQGNLDFQYASINNLSESESALLKILESEEYEISAICEKACIQVSDAMIGLNSLIDKGLVLRSEVGLYRCVGN